MTGSKADHWTQELHRHGVVKFHGSRRKMLLPLAGCLAFVALGAWITTLDADSMPKGRPEWGYVVFPFAFGLLFAGWRLITGRPYLRVDSAGIVVNRHCLDWNKIERIVLYNNTIVVMLTQQADQQRIQNSGPVGRVVDNFKRRIFHGPAWSASMTTVAGATTQELVEWLSNLHHARYGDAR